MTKDRLQDAVNNLLLIIPATFKDLKGDEKRHYLPSFDDHTEDEDVSSPLLYSMSENRKGRDDLRRYLV